MIQVHVLLRLLVPQIAWVAWVVARIAGDAWVSYYLVAWAAWDSWAACGAWFFFDTWVVVAILKPRVRLRPSLSGLLFSASEQAARCWLQLEMQHFHATRERTADSVPGTILNLYCSRIQPTRSWVLK